MTIEYLFNEYQIIHCHILLQISPSTNLRKLFDRQCSTLMVLGYCVACAETGLPENTTESLRATVAADFLSEVFEGEPFEYASCHTLYKTLPTWSVRFVFLNAKCMFNAPSSIFVNHFFFDCLRVQKP